MALDPAVRAALESVLASEPDNAAVLWERADNLRQWGKTDEARAVLRRLADGQWPEQHRGVQERARWELEQK